MKILGGRRRCGASVVPWLGGEVEDVVTELSSTLGGRGRAGRLRAAAWRLHAWIGSKGEASSAKQEVAGVDARHASPLLVLLAEEEEDKGGGGGLGRLGRQMDWQGGLGQHR